MWRHNEKIRHLSFVINFSVLWPKLINASDCDIVNLHWINGEMLSIKDIAKIKKPIVWTLHDMCTFQSRTFAIKKDGEMVIQRVKTECFHGI